MKRTALILLMSVATAASAFDHTFATAPGSMFKPAPVSGVLPVVMVGTNVAAYSFDHGVTWSSATIPAGTYVLLVWDGGKFIAVALTGATSVSVDGVTWAAGPALGVSVPGGSGSPGGAIASNGTRTVVGTSSNTPILMYGDGVAAWSNGPNATDLSPASNNVNSMIWSGSRYISYAASGNAIYSSNGAAWSAVGAGLNAAGMYGNVWINGASTLSNTGNRTVYRSADGSSWSSTANALPSAWNLGGGTTFASDGTTAVAVNQSNGRVATSTNGTVWADRGTVASNVAATWDGTFFILANYGSSRGTWTSATSGASWVSRGVVLPAGTWSCIAAPRLRGF